MESYWLFYSNSIKDAASRKFMRELENQYNINVNFNKICIDRKGHDGKRLCEKELKKYKIKKVPSVIINSNVYQGQDAFDWLSGQIFSSQSMTTYPGLNKNRYQQAPLLRPGQVQNLQAMADPQFPQQTQQQQGYQQFTVAGHQTSQPVNQVPEVPDFLKPMQILKPSQQMQMSDPTSQMMQERERQNQQLGLMPPIQQQMQQQPMQAMQPMQPMQSLGGLNSGTGLAPLSGSGMAPSAGMAPVYNPNVF